MYVSGMGWTIIELESAYFAHACFDQAINNSIFGKYK